MRVGQKRRSERIMGEKMRLTGRKKRKREKRERERENRKGKSFGKD